MIGNSDFTALITALVIGVTGATVTGAASAQTAPAQTAPAQTAGKAEAKKSAAAKPTKQAQAKQAKTKQPPAAPEPVVATADAAQLSAAERVFTGSSSCEFNQTILLEPSTKHTGYMELHHGKKSWLMRPVYRRPVRSGSRTSSPRRCSSRSGARRCC